MASTPACSASYGGPGISTCCFPLGDRMAALALVDTTAEKGELGTGCGMDLDRVPRG